MRIDNPQMFWLLLILLPPLTGFLWWAWRRRQQLVTQFISARLLGNLKVGVSPSRQKARLAMIVMAVVFVILALARPQWGIIREEARQHGLDIIVAIDTSNSMLAEDVPPNRLARAKLAALDLMHRARTDRLGLVAFAGVAFLQCPLTLDDAAFSQSVNALDTKTISQGGTAISEAIAEAGKAFKNESDNHKILVLFTDGEDHDSEAVAAAEKAAQEGMMIFTIGIGSPEGETLRIRDDHGRIVDILDEQNKPVISKLNEDLLKEIARVTKAFYLPLRGTKTMDTLYSQGLEPLPKSDKAVKSFQHYNERFQWPLAVAVALLLVEMFLPDRSRRGSKRAAASAALGTNAPAGTAAILLLLALLPLAAQGSSGGALREYNEGKYEDALKDYNKLLERKKDDPRLHFNAGDAAYQNRQLDAASNQFSAALTAPDLQMQQRAYYNLGNTLYRLGQQMPDAEKRQAAWENSIKSFESALKLNQRDADAKFNHSFVQRQLEELKKQEQQSQSKDNKDQKDQKQNQDQKNQQSKDQQDKDQKDSSQAQQKQDKGNQGRDSKPDNQAQQKSDAQKQQEEKAREQAQAKQQKEDAAKQQDPAQAQAAGDEKDKASEEARREAAMMAAGQMTPQQAKQLLDSQKGDERVFQMAPPNKETSQNRPYKNW